MKVVEMNEVALVITKGQVAVIIGDDPFATMRLMQLFNAEDEEDVLIFEMGDEELMGDGMI